MKRKVLFLAGSAIYNNDGYKSRIELEMDLLSCFELHILIPKIKGNVVNFQKEVLIHLHEQRQERGLVSFYRYIKYYQKSVNNIILTHNIEYIICEGLGAAIKAVNSSLLRKKKIIFDCHGTEADEYYLYHKNMMGCLKSKVLKYLENKVVSKCDILITVTEAQYKKWKIRKKNFILPMLPAEHFLNDINLRNRIRKDFKIGENTNVYVYSGGNEKWQMSDYMLQVYKKIEDSCTDVMLLIFTHDVTEFRKKVKDTGIKNFRIISVKYEDMPAYLDACDFGFCLRENNIINLVASPTKVLEYISRNVKPILTEYVGENNLAFVINEKFNPEIFVRDKDYRGWEYVKEYKQEIRERYIQLFDE